MRLYKVIDLNVTELKEKQYDIGILASGYEERCTYVPSTIINGDNVAKSIVFGFEEAKTVFNRPDNDKYYLQNWTDQIFIASDNDDTAIYNHLRRLDVMGIDVLRVIVDYSTMSRLWYASILNWVRFLTNITSVEIDFVYSFGKYKGDFSPLVIEDILAIPGYEGSPVSDARSLAIFGLGFDGIATLSALDQLEPNIVYAYLASPGAGRDYPEKAKHYNKLLISGYVKKLLELPISSIEVTFGSLTELISPHREEANIILIPMGPKPHVLAAILLCLRFERKVTCLRVRGNREPKVDVEAEGQVVATRVSFKDE